MKTEAFDHLVERIEQTLAANRPEGALSLVEAARATDDDPRLRRERARILSALGRFGDALDELTPLAVDDFPARAAAPIAWTLNKMGRPDLALPFAQSGVDQLPGTPAPISRHVELATALTMLGRPGDAVSAMERAVAVWPDDPTARAWLARALVAAQRREDAIDMARKVLEGAPDHPIALAALGFALLELDCNADALVALERAVEVNPRDPRLWLSKGTAEQRLRKLPDAIASFERGVEVDPKNGLLRWQLAWTLSVSGRVAEALEPARRATELAPQSSGAWGVLAMVLIKSGDSKGGADALVEALQHPPVEPWVEELASKYGLLERSS